mmetsp:Transcript_32771/g.99022  ORF Transcript_32771/g.99022 Transcript_32771/m.99022 type:complete len:219 (-) Transcript_32771:1186-1842(-)
MPSCLRCRVFLVTHSIADGCPNEGAHRLTDCSAYSCAVRSPVCATNGRANSSAVQIAVSSADSRTLKQPYKGSNHILRGRVHRRYRMCGCSGYGVQPTSCATIVSSTLLVMPNKCPDGGPDGGAHVDAHTSTDICPHKTADKRTYRHSNCGSNRCTHIESNYRTYSAAYGESHGRTDRLANCCTICTAHDSANCRALYAAYGCANVLAVCVAHSTANG